MKDEEALSRALADYYKAFSTLNVEAILPYFHQPALLVAPAGVAAMTSTATLTAILAPAIGDLRARGYGHSEFELRKLTQLSGTAALATGVAVRYKSDGHELERVGLTYLMHKTDAGWKIATMIVHDRDADA